MHALTDLYLNHNELTELQNGLFYHLSYLAILDLGNNALSTLHKDLLQNLHQLLILNLYNNKLTTLHANLFQDLYNLTYLFLSSNKLIRLPDGVFRNLRSLTDIHLYVNSLVELPAGLHSNLQNLYFLNYGNNSITVLSSGIFDKAYALQSLYMYDNKITHCEDGSFSNLTALVNLSLTDNQLSYLPYNLFDDLVRLVNLYLSGNRLSSIPQIGHLVSLRSMDLLGNPLTRLTQNALSGVSNAASVFVNQPEVCLCYLNSSNTCYHTLKPSPYLTCTWLLSSTILFIFMWIIGWGAFVGNVFVLWWKHFKQRSGNKIQSFLLSNLAVSDMLMGIYMIIIGCANVHFGKYFPINAERWRSGVTCKVAGTLAITSSEASVFFVTFISIDRFIAIKFTFHKLGMKSIRVVAIAVWTFSLTLGLTASLLAGRSLDFYDNSHVCIGLPLAQVIYTKTKEIEAESVAWFFHSLTFNAVTSVHERPGLYFSVAVFLGLNMFCFLLILACYVIIIRQISQSAKKASRESTMAEEIRTTLKVSVIVLTDFLCWFPICVIGALVQIGVLELPSSVFAWVVTFVLPINSAINPFLYTIVTIISDKCSKTSSETLTLSERVQHDTNLKEKSRSYTVTEDLPKNDLP